MQVRSIKIDVMSQDEDTTPVDEGKKLDIEIFLDREVYFPGDTIEGRVTLNNEEARDMRGIKLTLRCKVDVMWSQKKGPQQFNDITYLNRELYIMGEGHQTTLAAGIHELTFCEPLTSKTCKDLPSSMEFPHGCVRYQVKVELDWPWSYSQEAVKTVNVVNLCNLVDHPESLQPASFTNQKRFGSCFMNKSIIIAGRLEKIAYVCGEHLLLSAEINNESDKNIKDTIFRINQIVTYISTEGRMIKSERVISEVRKGPLGANKDMVITDESLIIPAVPQSARVPCDFMNVAYQVEIAISLDNNKNTWDMMANQAIFIGTLPTKNAYKRFLPNKNKPLPETAIWPIEIDGLSVPTFEEAVTDGNNIQGGQDDSFIMRYPIFTFDKEKTLALLGCESDESEVEEAASQFSL